MAPDDPWDSGYAVWANEPDQIQDTRLVHLHCLLDDHPEVAHGLEHAREHGEAVRVDDGWMYARGLSKSISSFDQPGSQGSLMLLDASGGMLRG